MTVALTLEPYANKKSDRPRSGYSQGRKRKTTALVRRLSGPDVIVIRDYYRRYYRPLPPGLAKQYYRTGYLPRGWQRRMHPVPVYFERDLYRLPRGYRGGIIDGRAVVYNGSGMVIDVAVLF